jgi:hypothetical protein
MANPEAVPPSPDWRDVKRATLLTLVVHGLALLGVTVLLVIVVPRYEETFKNERMCLPRATQMVICASNLAKSYYYLLLPIILGADVGVFALLRSYAGTRTPSRVWSLLVLIGLLLFAGFTIFALRLPWVALSGPRSAVIRWAEDGDGDMDEGHAVRGEALLDGGGELLGALDVDTDGAVTLAHAAAAR